MIFRDGDIPDGIYFAFYFTALSVGRRFADDLLQYIQSIGLL